MGARQKQLIHTGLPAPPFTLRDVKGQARSLESLLSAGPVLLAFFKISCPVCQFTFPFLDRLYTGEHTPLQFVGISQDSAADTEDFMKEFGVTFPVLIDDKANGYQVSNAFGISSVPTLFLVEQDGTIAWTSTGFSKRDIEDLGRRVRVVPFKKDEYVPEWRAG